jgi:hypothetical protein
MPLRRLLPLLFCPLCAVAGGSTPRPLLHQPFTLHCGHTVCSSHLKTLDPAQRCPLPVCSSTPNPDTTRPNIPSTSRVVYLPAVPPPASVPRSTSASFEQRVDITISKLIEVVSRHSPPPPPPSSHGDSDHSDGDDHQPHPQERPLPTATLPSSDEETEFPVTRDPLDRSSGHRRRRRRAPEPTRRPAQNQSGLTLASARSMRVISADSADNAPPSSSGHAGRSSTSPPRTASGESSDGSDSSTEPPKKRRRHDTRSSVTDRGIQSSVIEPEAGAGNSESVDALQPSHPGSEPRQDPERGDENLQTRIEKALLTELSCEICFTIYYQPVTTPCQHVSCLLFLVPSPRFCHPPLSTRSF